MVARTFASVIVGVDSQLIEVETDIAPGLPGVTIVGLADTAVNEARERVKSAMANSQVSWPKTRVTIALLPASVRKRGSGLDAAIAASILAASAEVPIEAVSRSLVIGELGLDGALRAVPGVIAAALAAKTAGLQRVLVPVHNAAEAALVPDIQVGAINDLRQLIRVLRGEEALPEPPDGGRQNRGLSAPDLADVKGQQEARYAIEVAAAGGHHLSMIGTPGVGKTLLAERLPGLLPPLDDQAALETTAIASIAGRPNPGYLQRLPPFEAPHHTASQVSITGGGQAGRVRMGAMTLAHHGVLFLDEAPEFDRRVLEAMRQPLESGIVRVHRAEFAVHLPARFHLVIASNPCPCGQGVGRGIHCTCSPMQRRRYSSRLTGPLLDRIDVRLTLTKPSVADLYEQGESSAAVAQRVQLARERSAFRWRERRRRDGGRVRTNADMLGPELRRHFPPTESASRLLMQALDSGTLSMRGADRVLRIAWTLADLSQREQPSLDDIGYAMSLRGQSQQGAA